LLAAPISSARKKIGGGMAEVIFADASSNTPFQPGKGTFQTGEYFLGM